MKLVSGLIATLLHLKSQITEILFVSSKVIDADLEVKSEVSTTIQLVSSLEDIRYI